MPNKFVIILGLCLGMGLAFHSAMAQDTSSDGMQILGTVTVDKPENYSDSVQAVMGTGEADTEDTPESAILDPDFLSDDTKSYDDYNKVVIRILDKVTAESRTYDLNINKTVAFGSIRIQPKACKKAPPIEEPESAAFLQIWEKTPEMTDEWEFTGWMFASSPSLSSMEHPVYDVWVLDCKD